MNQEEAVGDIRHALRLDPLQQADVIMSIGKLFTESGVSQDLPHGVLRLSPTVGRRSASRLHTGEEGVVAIADVLQYEQVYV